MAMDSGDDGGGGEWEKDEALEEDDSRCAVKKANALDVSAEANIPTLLKAWLAQKSGDPARSARIMRF
jgi:hypothetical protein